jgi:hypothetical protein
VDWGIFITPLSEMITLTRRCTTQSAESMKSIIARNFVMVDGGVTAHGPDDGIVGVSKYVPKENGLLSFLRPDNSTTVSPDKVYCKLVSLEKFSSL